MADGPYTLPELPYDYGALEPHMSGQIMELHHDKHHAAYVKGANTALEALAEARDSDDFSDHHQAPEGPRLPRLGPRPALDVLENLSPDGGGEPEGDARRRRSTRTSAASSGSRPT